jgi:hypothetical protein
MAKQALGISDDTEGREGAKREERRLDVFQSSKMAITLKRMDSR